MYGATSVDTSGIFTRLQFVSTGEPCTFFPIILDSVVFDTGEEMVTTVSGGLFIHPVPFYGDVDLNGIIQAHDSAMILKHLVGIDTLGCQDSVNANVSLDTTISALDASLIAMYGVGIIDSLPYDSSEIDIEASGTLTLEDQSIIPGSTIDISLQLEGGENILAFEIDISYNRAFLNYNGFTLSDEASHLGTIINITQNQIRIAGAGTEPDGTTGEFGTLHFQVVDEPPSNQTKLKFPYKKYVLTRNRCRRMFQQQL